MMQACLTPRERPFAALGTMFAALLGLAACLPDLPESLPGPAFETARAGAWDSSVARETDQTLTRTFAQARAIPGATALGIALRSGAQGQWQDGFPSDTGRLWWASSGKLVTTILALQEVEAGRLALDAPLAPRFGLVPAGITLRHLLSHTSGVADFSQPDLLAGKFGHVNRRTLIRAALAHPRDFAPGQGWAYSNTGFLLIQDVLEALTGQSYAQLVKERIARPLTLAGFAAPAATIPPDLTLPPLGHPRPASEYPPNIGGAGSVIATAGDMARFWQAAMAGELVGPALLQGAITTLRPMFDSPSMQMGTGIIYYPASDGSGYWLGHGGGADQVGALVLYSPRRQLVLAIAGIGPKVQAIEIANLFIKTLDTCGVGSC